ncbi:DNA-entry nuclease [Lentibacillus kapialis]|uniref:DNA-entry nuclease n=1 Tax=Lentibacillus kapialis TaxID=340214 RepID=UPI00166996C3|nr:DNA-entry nuclease [Lentibacillus kapialis]
MRIRVDARTDKIVDGYEYDKFNRMRYHPDFHFKQGQKWTEEELEYLCMFFDYDDSRTLSFALGKTETVCQTKALSLKKTKMFEHYRNNHFRKMEG